MLYTETVDSRTLSLLKDLMTLPELDNFCLVGGTALSLKHGHRISIDLDLFSVEQPDFKFLSNLLMEKFSKNFEMEISNVKFALFCKIFGIKTDLVHYPHKLISEIEIVEGIRFYSDKDIAAMKINAILGRGVKKDFWDLYLLLQLYSLEQIIEWHRQKFPSQMLLISIPNSLVYFDDAEQSPDPVTLRGITWEAVKKELQAKVRDYLK